LPVTLIERIDPARAALGLRAAAAAWAARARRGAGCAQRGRRQAAEGGPDQKWSTAAAAGKTCSLSRVPALKPLGPAEISGLFPCLSPAR
jgi:hypothetical protein